MKKTKIMAIMLVFGMAALTSCKVAGNDGTTPAETSVPVTTAEETTTEETSAETTTEATTTTVETTTVTETTLEETSTVSENSDVEETTAEETRYKHKDDERYIDFDDMHFFVNGKKYTLGKTTLREMIDDGVPFDEEDTPTIQGSVKADHFSQPVRIRLGKNWSAQVSVVNDTDEERKADELVIAKIYLPNRADQEQDILSFDFPIDLKPGDLVAVEGKTNNDNCEYKGYKDYDTDEVHDSFTIKKRSEKYYGDSIYCFEFINDALDRLTIEYRP